MKIIPGPASKELARKIAGRTNDELITVVSKTFPDGEAYVRFDVKSLQDKEVAIVQTTSPPQNKRIIQLLLMADTALDMEARSITAVVPYLAYSRQDRRFLPGEAFSIKTIIKLLEECGVDQIITVNAHNPKVLKTFDIPIEDVSAIPLLARYFKSKGLVKKPISLSLGKKALKVSKEADSILGGGFDYVSTKRDVRTGEVTLQDKDLKVEDRDVVIFDDIISSGGTMAKAVDFVKRQGANKVYSACVHPLLMGDAERRIRKNGSEAIIGTDSVPSPFSRVSIAPLISKALIP